MLETFRPALRAERLRFCKEIECKIKTFCPAFRAERLKKIKEIECKIESVRSALRAESFKLQKEIKENLNIFAPRCARNGLFPLHLSVRLIKRPRGAPGPREQLNVRQELRLFFSSVREVPPDPESN